ncbi:class I SAM-dependent methyltransferase [Rhodophyticola sp. SM2404]
MSASGDPSEAFPYPERDPAQETKRLTTGSPSHPLEIDHYIFEGKRDWSKPIRILAAAGGTGDAVIQMAQVLSSAKKPYEITYLDPSKTARDIAEARAEARGLQGITFKTGSLLEARRLGRFDYIDCSGGVAALPKPQAGFNALAKALVPRGGIGLMLPADLGRAGAMPLREVFGALLDGPPEFQLRKAQAIYARLPDAHPIKRNPILRDQIQSDAGFYELLLRGQGVEFSIRQLLAALRSAGLSYVGSPQSHLYNPLPLLGDAALVQGMDRVARMELAENLRGTIKAHILYAAREAMGHVAQVEGEAVPHLRGVSGQRLAQVAAKTGVIPVTIAGEKLEIPVSGITARALAQITGRASLAEIAQAVHLDWDAFAQMWQSLSDSLTGHGLLYYSQILR